MALSFLKSLEQEPSLLLFGKLPQQPDFIRINATHPVAQELDECIQLAMNSVASEEGWEATYDAAPPSDLIYTSSDRRWQFHGSILPSRDSSGRRYPLVAGTLGQFQNQPDRIPLIPTAREAYFETIRTQLRQMTEISTEGWGGRESLELCNLREETMHGCEWDLASGIRNRYMVQGKARVFEDLFAKAHCGASLRQAFLNMAFYRDFMRNFTASSVAPQLITLPLGLGAGETTLHATVWLSLVSALALVEGGERECIQITHEAPNPQLRLSYGRSMTQLFASVLGFPLTSESCLNIFMEHSAWQAHRLYAQSAYAMDRLMNDPETTLTHLMEFLKNLQQKIANPRYH